MMVRQSTYERAKREAQYAYDRADALLGENEKLLNELAKANERLEMMSVCVIDTLREALGMGEPKAPDPVFERSGLTPASLSDVMPKEIALAIDSTFPDDAVIRAANLKYAFSQADRWETEYLEIADEIRQGA